MLCGKVPVPTHTATVVTTHPQPCSGLSGCQVTNMGRWTPNSLPALLLLATLAGSMGQSLPNDASLIELSLGPDLSTMYNGTLASGMQTSFEIKPDAYLKKCLGLTPDLVLNRFIHVQLWNVETMSVGVGEDSSGLVGRADPMLMMANSRTIPIPTYQMHQSDWSWSPPNSIVDFEGYRLLRPYHHVMAAVNETNQNSDPWYITISNIDIWMMQSLDYKMRISCVEEVPCPSMSFAEECSGHGQCIAGSCECDMAGANAWGDVGCDALVKRLENGVSVSGAQSQGSWSYYAVQVPEGSNMLLVDMERMRGDPVLFVKHQEEGFASGGLPAVLDYDSFADQDSFRSRLNFHHITVLTPKAGIYYVGVYNNDVYIKEAASFSVKARWSNAGGLQAFCPADCNPPQGKCMNLVSGPDCDCATGFGGELCEGVSETAKLGDSYLRSLKPGQWVYYRLTLSEMNYMMWKDGLVVEFTTNDQGHPVLILKRDTYPSMLDNDYIFTSSQMMQGLKRFKLEGSDLSEGEFVFGVFNMDYYRHEEMDFSFKVSAVEDSGLMPFTPYMSIVLGVTVSLFLCLFMSICKRLVQRHGLFGHPPPEQAAPFMSSGPRPGDMPRGVDRETIEGFPSYTWEGEEEELSAKELEDVERNSDGMPSCSVCLCPYENGEMIRRLPCEHEFHMKCIDHWLTQRTTCPMCRVALVSEVPRPSGAHAAGANGQQGAVSAPSSPPGTADANSPTPSIRAAVARAPPDSPVSADAYNSANEGTSSSTSPGPPSSTSSVHCDSPVRPSDRTRESEMVVITDMTAEPEA